MKMMHNIKKGAACIISAVLLNATNTGIANTLTRKTDLIISRNIHVQPAKTWIDLLNKYQSYLNARFTAQRLVTESQLKTAQILKQKVSRHAGETVRSTLIEGLLWMSVYPQGMMNYSGFIEDSTVFGIFIGALTDSSKNVRNSVFYYLLKYGRTDWIWKHSNDIKNSLTAFSYPDDILLAGLLNLAKEEKTALLLQKTVPVQVRARWGDQQVEDALINQFEQAKSYQDKYEAVNVLGYVGTEKCAKALIKSLSDNLIREGAYEQVAIRFDIIKNLGRIHPENPLLTIEINKIHHLGDEAYGGDAAIKQYLHHLSDWCMTTYKIRPDLNNVHPAIYKRIIAPLK